MYIANNSDLDQLREKIKPILGQLCWEVRLSYGDELCLEIGKEIAYNSAFLQDQLKGEWQFGSRGTEWQLLYNKQIITTSDLDSEQTLPYLKLLEGTSIIEFDSHYSDLMLTIGFNNGYQLKVIPDLTDTEYQDVACWELFTPNNRILEVYPNFTWYDRPSDIPISEMVAI
jgi:hypothetical protein